MFTPRRRRSGSMLAGFCQALLPGVAIALLAGVPVHAQEEGDPPAEVARVSVMVGNVSMEPASVDQFSAAVVNDALTTGDRLYTDVGANAELETGQIAVRLGQQTDLTITAMTDPLEQFGLAQGSVHLRSFALAPGTAVELDTPNAAVTVLQAGDVRVDVDPDGGATTVVAISGQVQLDGNGFQQVLQGGQSVRLEGTNPVSAQAVDAVAPDGLDGFSNDRNAAYQSGAQGEDAYVNPSTIGAEDLNGNGNWETDPDEGAVWYPTNVAAGWVPYSCGNWTWMAPWGWTWVDCASWGFAPFHYGRWEHRGSRWGWIPGPRVVRPIYSPAMVAFVGGPGVTAWFALGPHDTYVPWYHASPQYENRVNVSNQYDRNAGEVRAIYNEQTLAGAYAGGGAHGYANRPLATVAVTQANFAAGRPVGRPDTRVSAETVANAPVVPHPLVTPQRTMVVGTSARAVPARGARPALASRTGEEPASETRTNAGQHGEAVQNPAAENRGNRDAAPGNPVNRNAPAGNPSPVVRSQVPFPPAEVVAPQSRPLFHQADPPPPRPSFDEQQKAIETNDPGRPLGPQQLENLRQNRPAGPPQRPESPHPPPAPRPSPPPRPSPSPAPRSVPSNPRH
jgi:hypothetical protein